MEQGPKEPMKLIITRHGETEENRLGIFQGQLPGKLTKTGIEQAKKLALRLKEFKIDYIYSSDLARAADTTKEIVLYHPDVPLIFTEKLRETYCGNFEGKTKEEVRGIEYEGETDEETFIRAREFLHSILEKHTNDTILFVGHAAVNRALISAIMGKDHECARTMEEQHNTNVSIFEIYEDKTHQIKLLNCIEHLHRASEDKPKEDFTSEKEV